MNSTESKVEICMNVPSHSEPKCMDCQELDGLADPMRKEISLVRKKIDAINKELKPLGQTCQKKVKATSIFYPIQEYYLGN